MTLPEGSGRYDALHGDENEKLALDLDAALEDVVETIMLFGRYPQARRLGGKQVPMQFSLYEYLENEWDSAEMSDLLVPMLTDFSSDFESYRMTAADALRNELNDHLRDSAIVHAHAERVAQQKKEDGE